MSQSRLHATTQGTVAEKGTKPLSTNSSIRSSHDGPFIATPDKAHMQDRGDPGSIEKPEEGETESQMYELNAPQPRRSFLRRHMFVVVLVFIGLVITGVVVGVLVVKAALANGSKGDQFTWVHIEATDTYGNVFTTILPDAMTSGYVVGSYVVASSATAPITTTS